MICFGCPTRNNPVSHFRIHTCNQCVKLGRKSPVDFATTLNVSRVTRHSSTSGTTAFAHPLQVVRIVSSFFNASRFPGPQILARRAEHLVTSFRLVNVDSTSGTRAGFRVRFHELDGFNRVWIANMRISFFLCGSLDFVAVRA